jgi:hypothetical protein
VKLLTLHYCTNHIKKFSEAELHEFYSYLPEDDCPQFRSFGLRMIAMFGNTCVSGSFHL